jgi:hypothetical protein
MQKCRRSRAGLIVMVNGAAVLEYGNHLPSLHEPPFGFAVRTTVQDKGGTCKTARFCNGLRMPPCPQSSGRSRSGKRKTANDCRTPRRLRRWGLPMIAINRSFSFNLESPTHGFCRRAKKINQANDTSFSPVNSPFLAILAALAVQSDFALYDRSPIKTALF